MVEGRCLQKYGWIIAVYNIADFGEGLIFKKSDLLFIVKHNAVTFRPLQKEMLDGELSKVLNFGLHVSFGPMTLFISSEFPH